MVLENGSADDSLVLRSQLRSVLDQANDGPEALLPLKQQTIALAIEVIENGVDSICGETADVVDGGGEAGNGLKVDNGAQRSKVAVTAEDEFVVVVNRVVVVDPVRTCNREKQRA